MPVPKGYRKVRTMEQRNAALSSGTLDELCKCGHLQSYHAGEMQQGSCNHAGPDLKMLCGCLKFTWVAFVERIPS